MTVQLQKEVQHTLQVCLAGHRKSSLSGKNSPLNTFWFRQRSQNLQTYAEISIKKMSESARILGSDGPFANSFSWFAVRDCQLEMADAIESAIDQGTHLIAESGTGTGKTFAYLVPPLRKKKKVVVSTRTKNLQEQLYHKDVRWVQEALNLNLNVQILKGRSNYLCLYRYENITGQKDLFDDQNKLERVYDWISDRDDGDISNYPGLSSEERAKITSTAQSCLGSQCEFARECYANRARKKATSADVVIINHSLLCLNFPEAADSDGGLFANADVVIVDEAHRFPDVASETIGVRISNDSLNQYCDDLMVIAGVSNGNYEWFFNIHNEIKKHTEIARTQLPSDFYKCTVSELEKFPEFVKTYWQIVDRIDEIYNTLSEHAHESMETERFRDFTMQLTEKARGIFERQTEECACWLETTKSGFSISKIPLDPGKTYAPLIHGFDGSFIFTSATLAVGDDFSHFQDRIGLHDSISIRLNSPFDYKNQALIFLPPNMPTPQAQRDDYDIAVAKVVEHVSQISKGRMFALFTSHLSMEVAYRYLRGNLDFTLLKQGQSSPQNLLNTFEEDGNAVLLGTSTFWEGVDVRGDALSCVVISKLPFIPPNDPMLQARGELMQRNNRNIFLDWQVPTAVLSLKQGVGRLIRDVSDKGVLVLCDPRITGKPYGRTFLDSMPPMKRTNRLSEVDQFFSNENSGC